MRIEWEIGEKVRCDVIAYKAVNLEGKRSEMRLFPTGSRQGRVQIEDLQSMGFRTRFGTRVILITHPGEDWEEHPWRCIRMLKGSALPVGKNRMPGIRIPDLDLLDRWDARKTNAEFQSSYDFVKRLEDGTGWTFGRGGGQGIKGQVRLIRVEQEDQAAAAVVESEQNMAVIALAKRMMGEGADLETAVKAQLVDQGLSVEEAEALMAKHL